MSETKSIEDKLQIIKARNHGRDSIKDAIVTKQVEAMKYYTPENSEFHVGFEYEALWGVENVNGEWLKETFSKDQSILSLEDTVRVKHLDQEDIEYFGWEKSRLKDRYYNPVFKMHMIHQGTRVAIFYQDLHGDVPRFDGVINNKSEFKKLSKQLRLI